MVEVFGIFLLDQKVNTICLTCAAIRITTRNFQYMKQFVF